MKTICTLSLVSALALPSMVNAQEYPIGQPIIEKGMEIIGVYLQPITMDTEEVGHKAMMSMMHLPAKDSDIHLEADIHAVEDNPNGFAEGDWMPYLVVEYEIQRIDIEGSKMQSGTFMPMIANDGPHYGDNLKLDGVGKYKVTYTISPPSYNKDVIFGRHIDKETGVSPWFEPFVVSWEFDYAGLGRKGSY